MLPSLIRGNLLASPFYKPPKIRQYENSELTVEWTGAVRELHVARLLDVMAKPLVVVAGIKGCVLQQPPASGSRNTSLSFLGMY